MHPQTLFDASQLAQLRSVRGTTHASLASNLLLYLNQHNGGAIAGRNVAGFAAATRIWGDRPVDRTAAINSLWSHCNATWATDRDLSQAQDILSGAIGYDLLFDLLSSTQRQVCRARISASASDLANAAESGIWWTADLVNNHNWVNFAAIGVAGQALEGEDGNADRWRDIARINFQKVKAVQDLVTDGSWHEGIGYLEFGLGRSIPYWLGAVRRGSTDDRTALLSKVGRYILYAQLPNQPRVHVMTHGDWNWSRPGLIAVLRWAARRYSDPFAAEAARRWDLDPRLTRQEFGLDYALEYISYDPQVPTLDLSQVSLDVYNEDQQSVILRNSWNYGKQAPQSDTVVVGFKAGVFGGRGNFERVRTCAYPEGLLNISHDHEDDLGLWIYGKGGWLLPEAVAYNCCYTNTTEYQSTSWHNTFLFDGQGQLGDRKTVDRQTGKNCGTTSPSWFYAREASMLLHASTDHYAFARADGRALYPVTLNVTELLRTVGFSREHGGFIALHDKVSLSVARKIEQLFHSMTPSATNDTDRPWLRLTNLNSAVLAVRILSPSAYQATVSTQVSNNYREDMDDDGRFGLVRVAPSTAATQATFLEVLWPTRTTEWASRPSVQPLDGANPARGFAVPLGAGQERWVYNTSDATSAGGLTLHGADIGIVRSDGHGVPQRLVLSGRGSLSDEAGLRLLLASPTPGVVEVAFSGTGADLSGSDPAGVQFFGPSVTDVRSGGQQLEWTRQGATVTVKGESDVRIRAGRTPKGQTNWQAYVVNGTAKGIFVDVDTSSGGFTTVPAYVTSLAGDNRHWSTTGGSNPYGATASGFRIYVRWVDNMTPPTPQSANADGWHINWIGCE
jgi:hypothetical protein